MRAAGRSRNDNSLTSLPYRVATLFTVCTCLLGCSSSTQPGGYSEVAVDDATVVAAAEFAVQEHATATETSLKLVKVLTAKSQVVDGVNYELELQVDEQGTDKTATVVVTRRWDDSGTESSKLGSWRWNQ